MLTNFQEKTPAVQLTTSALSVSGLCFRGLFRKSPVRHQRYLWRRAVSVGHLCVDRLDISATLKKEKLILGYLLLLGGISERCLVKPSGVLKIRTKQDVNLGEGGIGNREIKMNEN